jgi:hypothetical protein
MKSTRSKKTHHPTAATASKQKDYGAVYRSLRCIQRPFFAVEWRIEQECARIETAHELAKWNEEK